MIFMCFVELQMQERMGVLLGKNCKSVWDLCNSIQL